MTSPTDYLIGKAIEQERARIVAALKAAEPFQGRWSVGHVFAAVNDAPAPMPPPQEQQR